MKNLTPAAAKVEMKNQARSRRPAPLRAGRSYQWINQVLQGHVKSRPVLEEIYRLPIREKQKAAK